jgi:hypothetical protein
MRIGSEDFSISLRPDEREFPIGFKLTNNNVSTALEIDLVHCYLLKDYLRYH